jgi:hypothetical protein
MTSPQHRGADAEAPGNVPARVPWWLGRRIRLPVLLGCLGLAIFVLLTSQSSILSSSSGSSAAASGGCVPPAPPSLQNVPWRDIEALRASLLGVMRPLARARYAWGVVPAEVAWTDNAPQSIRASEREGLWPASYEMRSWTIDPQLSPELDDVVADVFVFTDSVQARRFFAEATSPRCHLDGIERATPEPPQARNLIWVNPDNATQEDVFLLRAASVYRISDVRPARSSWQPGVSRVNVHLRRLAVVGRRGSSLAPSRANARRARAAPRTRCDASGETCPQDEPCAAPTPPRPVQQRLGPAWWGCTRHTRCASARRR